MGKRIADVARGGGEWSRPFRMRSVTLYACMLCMCVCIYMYEGMSGGVWVGGCERAGVDGRRAHQHPGPVEALDVEKAKHGEHRLGVLARPEFK